MCELRIWRCSINFEILMIFNVFILYKLWAILLFAIQAFLDVGSDGLDSDSLSVVLDKVEVGKTI